MDFMEEELFIFFEHLGEEPLSGAARSLWLALLHANKEAGWAEEFSILGAILKVKCGSSGITFRRARKELIKHGYIEYRPGRTRGTGTMVQLPSSAMDHGACLRGS
ncbi:hypothetical protein [Paucisalibacillus sp. EB02]|uniref:hypothetical protein n=1 Tax=Paucisalibacillus sp. EB02 TaxID=1347087 RepID=UPI0004B98541|nr:hypothetical protein [Paucisalibacillus sp. EB02]